MSEFNKIGEKGEMINDARSFGEVKNKSVMQMSPSMKKSNINAFINSAIVIIGLEAFTSFKNAQMKMEEEKTKV